MTAAQLFDLGFDDASNDFEKVIRVLETLEVPWCVIGGIAVNAYVEPVYTGDIDFVVVANELTRVCATLISEGFQVREFRFWVNARQSGSDLTMQFTTDVRYQEFLSRAVLKDVYAIPCRIAALEDVFQGKLWAAIDPERRPSKRKKDESDLLRIAESFPAFIPKLPPELQKFF